MPFSANVAGLLTCNDAVAMYALVSWPTCFSMVSGPLHMKPDASLHAKLECSHHTHQLWLPQGGRPRWQQHMHKHTLTCSAILAAGPCCLEAHPFMHNNPLPSQPHAAISSCAGGDVFTMHAGLLHLTPHIVRCVNRSVGCEQICGVCVCVLCR
jgi:hypothetical protein